MNNGNDGHGYSSKRRHLMRLHPREGSDEISQGRSVLVTDRHGFIQPDTSHGLFVHQTRMLSRYHWLLDGDEPLAVALSNVEQHSWLGYYIQAPKNLDAKNRDRDSQAMAAAAEHSIELRLSRSVTYGLHEDVDLTNFTMKPVEIKLQLEIDADFADQQETVDERKQFGELAKSWRKNSTGNWELGFEYISHHHYKHQADEGDACIRRSLVVEFANCSSEPQYTDGCLSFAVALQPMQSWHACIRMRPRVENEPEFPLASCYNLEAAGDPFDETRSLFLRESTSFTSPESGTLSAFVIEALEQAKRDLASLRLHDLDRGARAWVPAAGIPIFIALFGRDTLITSWEAGMLSTQMMQGTLPTIANRQGKVVDDWRDEQPGRMLHEAHTGPLAQLGFNPRARYYGSATTSGFFPVALAQLWHWTGDKQLVQPLIEAALEALRWKDNWADANGDGFYEYQTHSSQGIKNQGWKDSGDGIVYADGRQVDTPISTCEEQAIVYAAKLEMAEMLWWFGRKDEAQQLQRQAAELKKRFNNVFWMENEGYIALGLDPKRQQITAIASNAGHCLTSGIIDDALVARVAERMFRDDMFSGWGVRTLSTKNPAFNPFSYQRGAVWPVEHGSFSLAFMRYGMWGRLEQIARGMFEAASLFDFRRLPEVFSGHHRDERHPFPALYPRTNWPQAWSAGAVFMIVQSLLGLYPYAPLDALFVDPHLPEWLPELTLSNLHVGKSVIDIRFRREADGSSSYEVLDRRGPLHIARQPRFSTQNIGSIEQTIDALVSTVK